MEKELKPFDKVLVRNCGYYWIPALYGFKSKDMKHHLTSAGWQDECIPYEGNEEYLGTNKDYVFVSSPELKESEDERIRKRLIERLKCMEVGSPSEIGEEIAWLEKQGEQKHAEWHREDEHNLNACLGYIPDEFLRRWLTDTIHVKYDKTAWSEEDERIVQNLLSLWKEVMIEPTCCRFGLHKDEVVDFLKSLKDRVQPKQEWSEEDKMHLDAAIHLASNTGHIEIAHWLKSLKDRYTWKPNNEHYELEEFAKIVRGNLTGICKAVQKLFEAKYLQLTGNKMYGGFKD